MECWNSGMSGFGNTVRYCVNEMMKTCSLSFIFFIHNPYLVVCGSKKILC